MRPCRHVVAPPLVAILAVAALAACEPDYDPTVSCDTSLCGNHGTCSATSSIVTCTCDPGYAGDTCLACAVGHHRVSDICAADVKCAPTTCGTHGTCSDATGAPTCACATGYTGEDCSGCYPGYSVQADAGCVLDHRCAPTSCSGAGQCDDATGVVACTCNPGYQGAACEACASGYHRQNGACVVNVPCPTGACSGHGRCDDKSGVPLCTCDIGYSGNACAGCYAGYHGLDAGTCTLDSACAPTTCSGAGTCRATGGVVSCTCNAGYQGSACDACATGYHRDSSTNQCAPDQLCATMSHCSPHSRCDDSTHAIVCVCDTGYAGPTCAACYSDFHDNGAGMCVLDEFCGAASCSRHGKCDDSTGVVTCACDVGWSGGHCETNVDDCVNTACGSGTCIDLVHAHVCLCADGTYGQSCPMPDAAVAPSDMGLPDLSPI